MIPLAFKARAEAAHPIAALAFVPLLQAKGLSPKESIDALLYTAGYITTIHLGEVDVMDALGMLAAGVADAKLDKAMFEEESKP